MRKVYMSYSGADLDEAVRQFKDSLVPRETLPAQVILHANCNPVLPKVILTWQFRDEYAEGIMIRRKRGSAPVNILDGDLVCDIQNTETTKFSDTDFTTDIGTITEPATFYYRAFPYNGLRQFQTQYQTSIELGCDMVGVYYLPDGSVLGDIPDDQLLKKPIKFMRWGTTDENVKDLVWEVEHIDRLNEIAYIMLKDPFTGPCMFDANEPGWTNTARPGSGNSRWAFSNLRQFFNATANKGEWFQKQHDLDDAPNYANNWPGLLHFSTEAERNLIVPRDHTLYVPTEDGGGTESVVDLVWAPSTKDLGLENTDEGDFSFDGFSTAGNRAWQYNYWTSTIYQHNSPTLLWGVSSAGALDYYYGNHASNTLYYAPRAGLVLPLSALLQYNEEEGIHHIVTTIL